MAHADLLTDLLCSERQLVAQAQLRLLTAAEQPQWDQLMVQHRYLRNARLVGEVLRYVAVTPEGRWLALLGWASPALHLRGRDRWLG